MSEPRYWFPAKRYGYGWGPPITWQGWVVLIAWIALTTVGSWFIAQRSLTLFFVFEGLMIAALVAVCYAKGEPPRWRWGEK